MLHFLLIHLVDEKSDANSIFVLWFIRCFFIFEIFSLSFNINVLLVRTSTCHLKLFVLILWWTILSQWLRFFSSAMFLLLFLWLSLCPLFFFFNLSWILIRWMLDLELSSIFLKLYFYIFSLISFFSSFPSVPSFLPSISFCLFLFLCYSLRDLSSCTLFWLFLTISILLFSPFVFNVF